MRSKCKVTLPYSLAMEIPVVPIAIINQIPLVDRRPNSNHSRFAPSEPLSLNYFQKLLFNSFLVTRNFYNNKLC